jgi:hypothetical protein
MAGPDGRRDNLDRVRSVLSATMPEGCVLVMGVAHDDGCPCVEGRAPLGRCTCETVDITLEAVDPRTS